MKIMIVEDEAIEAAALQKLLKQYYSDKIRQIKVCGDGREAVMQAERESFDLIFMDINLPFIDGVSASTQIRLMDKKVIIIIMLTAYSDFDYARESIDNQVFAYITKPYSVKTLRSVLDRIFRAQPEKEANGTTIEEMVLQGNTEGINIYLEELLNEIFQTQEPDQQRKKMYYSLDRLINKFSHYITDRERNYFLHLAEERINQAKKFSRGQVKADSLYLLKKLGNHIQRLMESNEEDIIIQVKKYIHDNYQQDIKLQDIADAATISRFYLSRLFKSKTGENIRDYILRTRLEKAKELLQRGHSVKEAAFKTGFNDSAYFSKCFKKETGISPIEYKNHCE